MNRKAKERQAIVSVLIRNMRRGDILTLDELLMIARYGEGAVARAAAKREIHARTGFWMGIDSGENRDPREDR
jgi:hypothetical protein